MYQRILVPIDGSATANRALVAAIDLAKAFGGRLRLVHVMDESAYLTGYDMYGAGGAVLIEAVRKASDAIIKDGVRIAAAAGVEAEGMVFDKFGERLGESVAKAVKLWDADLVVVGTHGRRGIGRVLLGSGAEQIIRLTPVPVLVIRSGDEDEPEQARAAG
jgi:nucleotide-binding universal stress UspA family protein